MLDREAEREAPDSDNLGTSTGGAQAAAAGGGGGSRAGGTSAGAASLEAAAPGAIAPSPDIFCRSMNFSASVFVSEPGGAWPGAPQNCRVALPAAIFTGGTSVW